ncbi:hypothetical protein Tco_0947828 [Tanacetum coccineum]
MEKYKKREKFEDNRFAKSITEGITQRIDYSLIHLKNQQVLYKVEDIATYLVEYVKFWDDREVDRYGNANLDSKRRAFWSLNEDILKITILKTNTPYPSRKIRRIRACTHQRPQRNKAQYAVSRDPYQRIHTQLYISIGIKYNILGQISQSWSLTPRIPHTAFTIVYLFFVLSVRNPFSSTTMGDENPIRTLGDYSKPSHEGYRNTIELPKGNNVVPLRFDTIRLGQNRCSFHGLRSEDPNQHLKDFLKLVGSLDLDGENSERTRLHLFQFSLRHQASNWLERLPVGSIYTWEGLAT